MGQISTSSQIKMILSNPEFWIRDFAPMTLAILIAIAGWLLQGYFERKSRAENIKNQIKYDIYSDIVNAYEDFVEKGTRLTDISRLSSLLISMDADLILGNVTKDPHYILTGNQAAIKKWHEFIASSLEKRYAFLVSFQKFSHIFESWESVLASCKPAYEIATRKIGLLGEATYKYFTYLQSMDSQKWTTWNRKELEEVSNALHEKILIEPMYIYDLMVIIHNELVSEFFGHQRPARVPGDPNIEVLTKEGLKKRKA